MSEQRGHERPFDVLGTGDETILDVVDAVVKAVNETTEEIVFPLPTPPTQEIPHGVAGALSAIRNGEKSRTTEE